MNRRNILRLFSVFTVSLFLLPMSCNDDECTKEAKRTRITSNSKSTLDTPTRENPRWYDYTDPNIKGGIIAGGCLNTSNVYYTCWWAGFDSSITITSNQIFALNGTNCIIKGNVDGAGTITVSRYASQLIIEGSLNPNVTVILNDNCTLTVLDGQLDTNETISGIPEYVNVPCNFELPQISFDKKTNSRWYYEEK